MDSPMQEQKSVISEVIDLKMALQEVLGMIREQNIDKLATTGAVPQSSLKLDNLRTNLLDCKDITNQIAKGLRLLV